MSTPDAAPPHDAPAAAAPDDRPGQMPPMVSYAQNFEDVMLRRALRDVERGFYVDVGAFDATEDSVTRWFYDAGWRGVNVEANPDLVGALAAARPGDVTLNVAVGAAPGTATLHVVGRTGLSTLDRAAALRAGERGFAVSREVEVEVLTLDAILDRHAAGRTIDFLKIDVEGAEARVLAGIALDRHRPRILVVEATTPLGTEPAWGEWEPGVLERGYHFAWFDGLNRFYVRREDAARLPLLAVPANVFDNFRPRLLVETAASLSARLAAAAAQAAELHDRLGRNQAWGDERSARLAGETAQLARARHAIDELTARLTAQTARVEALAAEIARLREGHGRG